MPHDDQVGCDPELARDTLLPFYENVYRSTIDRTDVLDSRLNLPFAVLTLVLGALAFLITNLNSLGTSRIYIVMYSLAALLGLSILVALVFLFRTIFGHRRAYMANLEDIDATIHGIWAESQAAPPDQVRDVAREFVDFQLQQYRDATRVNRQRYMRKTGSYHKAMLSLFFAIVLLVLIYIPFLVIHYSDQGQPQPTPTLLSIQEEPNGQGKEAGQEAGRGGTEGEDQDTRTSQEGQVARGR